MGQVSCGQGHHRQVLSSPTGSSKSAGHSARPTCTCSQDCSQAGCCASSSYKSRHLQLLTARTWPIDLSPWLARRHVYWARTLQPGVMNWQTEDHAL
jgi:hypothetical protein